MKKVCVLFCGQGSQAPGMGRELYDRAEAVRRLFETGSGVLGFDLAKTCFEADAETLRQTRFAQPAIFAVSMAGFLLLREELGADVVAVAGHSLGEYGALTAAGVYTVEDGFRVIKARSEAMEKCGGGAMVAVLGSDEATVERVCEETEGYVVPVNYNAPQQTVIAGDEEAVLRAAQTFEGMGLRTSRLAVSGAFHTSLMQPAADEFYERVREIPYHVPQIPFYSNTTGGRMERFDDLPSYLRRHMVSPVLFTRQLEALAQDGSELFVEVGPGKVVSGLVRRTLSGTKPLNLEDLKGLEKVRAALA